MRGSFKVAGSIAFAFLAATSTAGCVQDMTGELSFAECTNALDDDGDGRADCQDPDCWGYCGSSPLRLSRDASAPIDAQAAVESGQASGEAGTDAAVRDDDGGELDDFEDAGAPLPPPECECSPDETCVAGRCVPRDVSGSYELQVQSALVPIYDRAGDCIDIVCAGIPLTCDCGLPDPYVVVQLNGRAIKPLSTLPVSDDQSPSWPNAPVYRVNLSPSDRLEFVVLDSDQLSFGQDSEIFRCSPSLSALPSYALSCNPAPGMTGTPPAGTTYYITADARAVAPGK